MDFTLKLQAFQNKVDEAIRQWVPMDPKTPERLKEAMRYSMQVGGKRIRPVLLLGVFETAPSEINPLPAAVALECIHTYSLIHDDLPSMDNSDMRRGHPTSHIAFDEATAVLAGDGLLTMAFELLSFHYADHPVLSNALVSDLARAAGPSGMVGGQMQDILLERSNRQSNCIDLLHEIEDLKTGALFQASLKMGLRLTTHSKTKLEVAEELGLVIGRAFQIMDDILDAVGEEATVGKPVMTDFRNAKVTAISHYGLDGSRFQVSQLMNKAQDLLMKMVPEATFLSELLLYLQNRTS